ncbi:hypothetical protein JCM15457_1939 [Liquorilactobacillus sucicola DSM 21376 = JCM 15457]|uniref:Uncharacterized protein n=1 Tax=Liquorilactobacillus sucicola DSM 21376 = JCM 15457 TaxID=1423806 RepID=A0A023CYT5_9LACO|nr:hypothetical protein [Liquorilactobacillus sucicola]KRN06716.1 hypothetical protein FD15_GL000270 [Liquorilactobacillus sucicola DSM 21376 = JCM 15457]GAJ26984.1 hypothetical protein JCM15457_1939 [Liquorilactobacillus sucicola DSM 21376 = JCM 15457]
MINFDKDFLAGFVSGAVVGATGYKLLEDNAGDLKRLVKSTGNSLKTSTSGNLNAEPTLEELTMQKENLEDLIAEKELKLKDETDKK